MFSELTLARIVQTGFFVSGAILLLTVYFGRGGIAGMAVALAATVPFSMFVIFGMKCRNCGVSCYFDPNISGWNFTSVNLIKPVEACCLKCGAER